MLLTQHTHSSLCTLYTVYTLHTQFFEMSRGQILILGRRHQKLYWLKVQCHKVDICFEGLKILISTFWWFSRSFKSFSLPCTIITFFIYFFEVTSLHSPFNRWHIVRIIRMVETRGDAPVCRTTKALAKTNTLVAACSGFWFVRLCCCETVAKSQWIFQFFVFFLRSFCTLMWHAQLHGGNFVYPHRCCSTKSPLLGSRPRFEPRGPALQEACALTNDLRRTNLFTQYNYSFVFQVVSDPVHPVYRDSHHCSAGGCTTRHRYLRSAFIHWL